MTKIFFKVRGHGQPVILLHGFPMHQAVWNEFATALSADFKVYTPDLPGLGKSEILPQPFSVDDVATRLLDWIAEEDIQSSVIIGHSLGGYVTLAMVEKNPQLFSGFGLFHSTAYADNAEKKESRTKSIDFIKKNGVQAFTSNFIQPLFFDQGHPAIGQVRTISMEASEPGVVGYTQTMRDRPDRTAVLKSFEKPVLFIAGQHDQAIPVDSVKTQSALCKLPELHVLKNAAHMGMFESPEETLTMVKRFGQRCI